MRLQCATPTTAEETIIRWVVDVAPHYPPLVLRHFGIRSFEEFAVRTNNHAATVRQKFFEDPRLL